MNDDRTIKNTNLKTERESDRLINDYYGNVPVNRYAKSKKDTDEIRKVLPTWDILPPLEEN